MFSFLPGIPGADDLRLLARKVDTARHRGVPNGCVLELDLLTAPPETSGFDPMAIIGGGGRPLVLREAVAAIHRAAEDDRVAGLIARVQIPAAAAGPVQELRDAIAAFSDIKPSLALAIVSDIGSRLQQGKELGKAHPQGMRQLVSGRIYVGLLAALNRTDVGTM